MGNRNNGWQKSNCNFSVSNQSLERKPCNTSPNAGNGTDKNDNSQDFALAHLWICKLVFPRARHIYSGFCLKSHCFARRLWWWNQSGMDRAGNDGTEIPPSGNYIIKYSTIGVITANFDSAAFSITFSTSGFFPFQARPLLLKTYYGLRPRLHTILYRSSRSLNQTYLNSSADVNTAHCTITQDSQSLRCLQFCLMERSGQLSSRSASTATDINGYQVYYATRVNLRKLNLTKITTEPSGNGNFHRCWKYNWVWSYRTHRRTVYYIAVNRLTKMITRVSIPLKSHRQLWAPYRPSFKGNGSFWPSIKWSWRECLRQLTILFMRLQSPRPPTEFCKLNDSSSNFILYPNRLSANTSSGFL